MAVVTATVYIAECTMVQSHCETIIMMHCLCTWILSIIHIDRLTSVSVDWRMVMSNQGSRMASIVTVIHI